MGISIKILHLTNSSLAGAPAHISKCLNKYTKHESKTILGAYFQHPVMNNLRWNYDYVSPTRDQIEDLIDWCDIIHYHHKPEFGGRTWDKPSILQFQTQPEGHGAKYIDHSFYPDFKGIRTCIAQYQTRYYDYDYLVPNMIDIWDIEYNQKQYNDKIFFGYANFGYEGWAKKGVPEVEQIFKNYKNVDMITNMNWSQMMKIKEQANIVIGDCFTGSYHLSDLEGLAVGAVVFNNLDELVIKNIVEISGAVTLPFIQTDIENLRKKIDYYLKRKRELKEIGLIGRKWIETYWDPKKLVRIYEDIYKRA